MRYERDREQGNDQEPDHAQDGSEPSENVITLYIDTNRIRIDSDGIINVIHTDKAYREITIELEQGRIQNLDFYED